MAYTNSLTYQWRYFVPSFNHLYVSDEKYNLISTDRVLYTDNFDNKTQVSAKITKPEKTFPRCWFPQLQ